MRGIGHFSNARVQTRASTLHLVVARALNIDADPNYVGAMGHGPRHDLQQQFRQDDTMVTGANAGHWHGPRSNMSRRLQHAHGKRPRVWGFLWPLGTM